MDSLLILYLTGLQQMIFQRFSRMSQQLDSVNTKSASAQFIQF